MLQQADKNVLDGADSDIDADSPSIFCYQKQNLIIKCLYRNIMRLFVKLIGNAHNYIIARILLMI